ncbi:elongation of very long chain fatty acids protein AAEL008004-like [Anoplophora glabripennis]|uniref:elongation of very long chain fatty acids protein AAEL008004-like n=1 Tax=Anoplophora glabripennis TaxID=217634 RepID=UPI000874F534|nr:elongation of very long chain fatty acids protein AAEL008004-like [Anoplophora glabripennis]
MALVLKKLYKGYFFLFDELSDPRAREYVLGSSPIVPIIFIASYLYFIYVAGPKFMANRKPFRLKSVLIIYNLSQVIANLILLYVAMQDVFRMNLRCNLVDYSQSPEAKRVLGLAHNFHLLKIFDLTDTVFMVLKKNTRQITFLHVYHHCGMILATFITLKFFPGGEIVWTGVFNVIVHSIMYLYYLLASIDSQWKKNLLFKKFLTQIQLIQFVANIVMYGRLFFISCPFPSIASYLYVPQNIFMLALFGDFYIKTYILSNSGRKEVTVN